MPRVQSPSSTSAWSRSSWSSRPTAARSRDLARVQFLEGAGRATTSWFVATPDTVSDLSLILKVKVLTPVTCSFAVKLPVGTPLTWRVYRSALRRATDLVLQSRARDRLGADLPPGAERLFPRRQQVERQLLVN